MSNPFVGLAPFGQDYTSQYNFFENIKTIINSLEAKDPIIIESTTVPTQVQMETLYLAAAVGNTLPVPTSQIFIWVNQGVVQGEYRAIDDLYTNVNDISLMSGFFFPGVGFLMSNGDIIAGNQRGNPVISAANISKFDRKTGILSAVALTVDIPDGIFSSDPTGTKIAFTKLDGGSKRQVYTCTYPALGSITQLTTTTTDIRNPSWANGKISYLESVGGFWTIKIMNENGTGQTTVLNTGIATSVVTYQALSPDATKIIYTKASGTSQFVDVWKVNVNGTSNAKFVDSLNATDNPHGSVSATNPADCATSVLIPSWSADGLYVMYGRRRKNINTNAVDAWYTFEQDPQDPLMQALKCYYTTTFATDYTTKNFTTTQQKWGGSNITDQTAYVYVPSFVTPIYGGKAYLVIGSSIEGTVSLQNNPCIILANQKDGYKSTGKIYRTSQYVPRRNDFELIRQDVATGTETSFSVTKSELDGFDHVLIIFNGSQTAGAGSIKIYLNEDTGANYHNVGLLANTTILRMYPFATDSIDLRGSGAAANNASSFACMIYDIKSTDNYKIAMTDLTYTASAAAFAVANYFTGDMMTTWMNTQAIESLRVLGSVAFAAGATFSYYGIRGTPRFEEDL